MSKVMAIHDLLELIETDEIVWGREGHKSDTVNRVGLEKQYTTGLDSDKEFFTVFALLHSNNTTPHKFILESFWFNRAGEPVERPADYLLSLESST